MNTNIVDLTGVPRPETKQPVHWSSSVSFKTAVVIIFAMVSLSIIKWYFAKPIVEKYPSGAIHQVIWNGVALPESQWQDALKGPHDEQTVPEPKK